MHHNLFYCLQLLKNFADLIGIISVILLRHIVNDLLHAMKDDSFTPALVRIIIIILGLLLHTLNSTHATELDQLNANGIIILIFFIVPVLTFSYKDVTTH